MRQEKNFESASCHKARYVEERWHSEKSLPDACQKTFAILVCSEGQVHIRKLYLKEGIGLGVWVSVLGPVEGQGGMHEETADGLLLSRPHLQPVILGCG